jgi:hypothetical protein
MHFEGRVSVHGVIGDSQAQKLDIKIEYILSDSDVYELANLVVFVRRRTQFLY